MAIPISEDQKSAALKVCILAKIDPEPVGGHLVSLRDTLNAKVYLGCTLDASDQVHDWLELWVQSAEALFGGPTGHLDILCNAILDERWRRQVDAFSHLGGTDLVMGGWERTNPLPTFLDVGSRSPVHPKDGDTGTGWQLCRDEGVLQQKDLPSYGGSLHRYLYLPLPAGEAQLVPVTPGAPTNSHTKPLSDVLNEGPGLAGFNQHAGLMLARKYFPLSLEHVVDALSGAPLDGLRHGRTVVPTGERQDRDTCRDSASGSGFLLGSRGTHGRLLEVFYLKLRLLLGAVRSVYRVVCDLQQPLLNISAESFRVRMEDLESALPAFWTARVRLEAPGHAIGFDVEKGDARYYLSPLAGETSVYRPLVASTRQKGQGHIRIRKVLAESDDRVTVEGTFASHERLDVARSDLVLMHVSLPSGGLKLYAHLEADSALAAGEWRFRTVARHTNQAEIAELRPAEGVRLPEVPYEVIPLLSAPCDLYSLAVLFIRTLLVDKSTSLPVAVDEVFSLAHQVQAGYDPSTELAAQLDRVSSSDDRWLKSLGPHHLLMEDMAPEEAFGAVPPELWWETLAMILPMFPGLGPASDCRDYGAAQPGGLHRVFEPTLGRLEDLLRRTRRLILPDPIANRTIAAVIRRYLDAQPTAQ